MRSKTDPLLAFCSAIILMSFTGRAHASICQAMPGESWIPQKKLYSSAAPTATANEPLTLDFSGDSLAYASIYSNPDHPGTRYRLRVLLKTADSPNEFAENCDTGWQTLPLPFS